VLHEYQLGVLRRYSIALTRVVVEKICKNLDDRNIGCGIYLNLLHKAFDTVNHEILSSKLRNYDICGVAHQWFKGHSTNGTQSTHLPDDVSSNLETTGGVPRGSVLGPPLFSVYASDTGSAAHNNILKLFAMTQSFVQEFLLCGE
jgi:hypothetical protein